MSIAYTKKHNKRAVGNEVVISNEQHLIGISGVFTSTPNMTRLVEVPLMESPSSVIIPGYTEVPLDGPAPLSFQFAVDYSLGYITFNPLQNGNTIFATYKGRGSEIDAQDVDELQTPVGLALNQDGTLVAGIVRPGNISTVTTDDFVFPRDLTATRNLFVGGQNIMLNTAETGSPTLNAQLIVDRGSSTPVSLEWNESLAAWEFVNNVTPTFQFFNSGVFAFSGPLHIGDGTAAAPSYSFSSATGTGHYRTAGGSLASSIAGSLVFEVNAASVTSFQQFLGIDGTAALPSFAFASDIHAGIFKPAADIFAISTNSLEAMRIDASQKIGINTTNTTGNYQVRIDATGKLGISIVSTASASAAYLFLENDTGNTWDFAHLSSGTALPNVLAFAYNGSDKIRVDNTGHAQFSDGSFAAPGITFIADKTMGLSRPFTNVMGFSILGAEVARFTPTGDFKLVEGEKLILDNTSNVFLKFTTAGGFIGQSNVNGSLSFGSASSLTLFANSAEPTFTMLTDGTINFNNASQGTTSTRAIYNRVFQDLTSGFHRTFWLSPTGAGLGTAATGTVTVVNFAALATASIVVNGSTLTAGAQWTAATSNNATASSLATAINGLGFVTAVAVTNVVTITAAVPGAAGNTITLTTSDGTNLPVSGANLTGGADDFSLALGYKANGSTLIASTIDTHNSLPLHITINDTTIMQIGTSTIDVGSTRITSLTDPTGAQDAATKHYVDSVSAGLDPKASSRVATSANLTATASGSGVGKTLTNSGAQAALVLDGIAVAVNDRVLVKNQTTAKDNGIYTVTNIGSGSTNWVLTRATDFDGSPANEVSGGNFTFIETGTLLAGTGWVVVGSGTIVVDTDPINWTQFSTSGIASSVSVVSSDPGSPTTGQIWFNSTDKQFKGYNGTSIVIMG